MITQEIVVNKTKYKAPVVYSAPRKEISNRRLSKEELLKYIKDTGFDKGMYITCVKTPVRTLSQIEYVCHIQDDPDKVNYRYNDDDPMFLILMGCWNSYGDPWIRADSTTGYRRLSDEEYKEFVEGNNVYLQNRIQHWEKNQSRDWSD